jgi:hypothetical protein
LSTKKLWLPWENVFLSVKEVGRVAVRPGDSWVELHVCFSGERRFSIAHVMSWKRWNSLAFTYREELCMSFLNRLREVANKGAAASVVNDPAFAKVCPALHEHMTVTAFDDGQVRSTCSLVLFCEEGVFKACLTDRDTEFSLWGTGETFHGALASLESRLVSPDPGWRKKRPQKGRQGR